MSPTVLRIPSDDVLPVAVDAVVIGGGIVGSAAAYFLAKRGISVALIEKGHVGAEQSSRNWGWCRQQNRDERELPLAGISMQLWDELRQETGRDLGFRRCGLVYVTNDPRQLAEWDHWRTTAARQFEVNTRMLSGAEATAATAGTGRSWLGGVHSIDDGKAEPSLAAPILAEAARGAGAKIIQNCAARGLDISKGRVTGVVTERGLIKADAVLCAGGAWASAFCRRHGISFPQASVRQTILRTKPAPKLPEAVYTPDCALTRRLDGSYTMAISGKATLEITPQGLRHARSFLPMFKQRLKSIEIGIGRSFFSGPEAIGNWRLDAETPFERARVLDPVPNPRTVAKILTRARGLYPVLAGVDVAESWGGFVDCTPDAVPVISPVEALKGFFLAAGFSGHGFGIGPAAGKLAANLVANDVPIVDPRPFRLSRLLDGSKAEVGAV
ncbi:FAD-binding oxidoreductase [Mesorhizobium sp. B2-5-4]|uniref:NAD(P)/FAD-dependent oxidoreductase n=1 Tax=unclassified Mesorhizobium TaxID=325217 RepID=UPI001128BED2|nr:MULTISPECIES: FAD-binding oxidoreductase [unclassified Mesorhizobium]TPK44722.1 FAD-binding oxidoreductase [Mesorhizobium sp. B2-5-4]TPM05390.1 FAD-binding oxidoreductase [Mesorhizobium sp. B2-3-11]